MKKLLLLFICFPFISALAMDPHDPDAKIITQVFQAASKKRSLSCDTGKLKVALDKQFSGSKSPRLPIIEASLTDSPRERNNLLRQSVELTRGNYNGADLIVPLVDAEARERILQQQLKELVREIKEKKLELHSLPGFRIFRKRKLSREIDNLERQQKAALTEHELTDLQRMALAQAANEENHAKKTLELGAIELLLQKKQKELITYQNTPYVFTLKADIQNLIEKKRVLRMFLEAEEQRGSV